MTENKIKEIKVKTEHFNQILDGTKPFLFLRKTTLEKQEVFYAVDVNSDRRILLLADNVLLNSAETFPAIAAGISKTFSELVKSEKTSEKMKRYFNIDKMNSILKKMSIDEQREKNGEQPIYGEVIAKEWPKVARADKWLEHIGYSKKSPQAFLVYIIKKEN